MDKRDFRKLDAVTQAELRRVAVRMVQAGKTRREAATAVRTRLRRVLRPRPLLQLHTAAWTAGGNPGCVSDRAGVGVPDYR